LVKRNLFPRGFGRIVSQLKKQREDADYGDFIEITKEQAEREIGNAEEFLKAAEKSLVDMLIEPKKNPK
jgi:uncharacterized protein (UPF0332 family)